MQNSSDGMVKIDKKIEELQENKPVNKKFSFHIIKEDLISLMIDGEQPPHLINKNQFHAMTLAIINISGKINPEIDYISLFNKNTEV